jgi:hypothetical protein
MNIFQKRSLRNKNAEQPVSILIIGDEMYGDFKLTWGAYIMRKNGT